MNIYGYIKEASITDYVDSDALYQLLKDCPMTSNLELVECYDDMTIKMRGDLGFEFFKVVKNDDGELEAYKIAENSGEKLGDSFPLTSVVEEAEVPSFNVGDKFKNAEGAVIEVVEPTNEGRPQFNITVDGNVECRDTDSYESLSKILSANGYEKFTETELTDAEIENECSLKDGEIAQVETLKDIIEDVSSQLVSGEYNPDWLAFRLAKAQECIKQVDVEKLTEGSLRGATYTEIVRSIDDACSEEMDTEEIRKFLQDLIGYIRGTAEAYDVMVEGVETIEYLTEAPNPDNAEANELIKSALKSATFAIDNEDKLKDLGVGVEVHKWHEEEPATARNLHKVYLVGPKGRKLSCNTSGWNEIERSRDLANTSQSWEVNQNENTIEQTTYVPSKEKVITAKKELPVLKKRLKLYERRYGKDSSQYRELVDYIKTTERTIEKGISASNKTNHGRPHDDVDFKNYLDKEPVADRPKPMGPQKENPAVKEFKDAKWEEKYNAQQAERNKAQDEEDAKDIAAYAARRAEDKSRRDAQLKAAQDRTQATLKEIRDRIAASKEKRGEE